MLNVDLFIVRLIVITSTVLDDLELVLGHTGLADVLGYEPVALPGVLEHPCLPERLAEGPSVLEPVVLPVADLPEVLGHPDLPAEHVSLPLKPLYRPSGT